MAPETLQCRHDRRRRCQGHTAVPGTRGGARDTRRCQGHAAVSGTRGGARDRRRCQGHAAVPGTRGGARDTRRFVGEEVKAAWSAQRCETEQEKRGILWSHLGEEVRRDLTCLLDGDTRDPQRMLFDHFEDSLLDSILRRQLRERIANTPDVSFLELREQAIRWEDDLVEDRTREVAASHYVSTGRKAETLAAVQQLSEQVAKLTTLLGTGQERWLPVTMCQQVVRTRR
ncbi:hypothetical protein RRG08_014536 [Elysia crispata]|uniref:Uncharacterized protein n=1 Tax=Elysia crispata TaxID=231223 RepID=A0AAE1B5P2_9GAST|nr:hypothetical protein RRG08_014536 [Elysia crispata]